MARNQSPFCQWLAPLTNHQSGMNCAQLPKIAFVEESDRDAFGFLDPGQVIRGAHLIPALQLGVEPAPFAKESHSPVMATK
jgi:hypothetical protein